MTEITKVAPLPQRPELVPRDDTAVVATSSAEPMVATEDVHAIVTQYTVRPLAYKVRQGVYLLSVLITTLIAIRFVLPVLGADLASGFAAFIYGVTAPLVAPFAGLFGPSQFNGSALEPHAVVAMVVYALVAWLVARVVWILWGGSFGGDTRTGATTTSRSIDTRAH